jgi:hypothetical protein
VRSTNRPDFGGEQVASRRFTRWYLIGIVVSAVIGALIGLVWIAVGLWQNAGRP